MADTYAYPSETFDKKIYTSHQKQMKATSECKSFLIKVPRKLFLQIAAKVAIIYLAVS